MVAARKPAFWLAGGKEVAGINKIYSHSYWLPQANQLFGWLAFNQLQIMQNLLVAESKPALLLASINMVTNNTQSTRILIGCRKQTS